MIDGISFRLSTEQIKGNDVLEFKSNGNRSEAKYRGFRVCAYADTTHVTGSIHKYFNNGEHNANDFHLSEFIKALNDLAVTLNFNPDCVAFSTFEFGVNIVLPFNARTLVESLIYTKNGVEKRDGQGTTIELGEYNIKVYVKPSNDNPNMLRYEIHINKTRSIKNKVEAQGEYCRTLTDLTNPKVWYVLGKSLIEIYDTFVFVDIDSFTGDISADEYKWLCKASKSSYWLKKWDNRMSKQRELERLKKLISTYSKNKTNEIVRTLIAEKINSLIDIQDVTNSPTVDIGRTIPKVLQIHQRCESKTDPEMLQIHRLDNRGKRNILPSNNRVCKVTGLSLEIGIKQGEYLSTKGVEFYYKNRPEIFGKILLPRLPQKWQNDDLKIQFREIAHSIRNEIYNPKNNPRNNFKRDIEKRKNVGCGFLFSLAETIRPDKRKLFDEIFANG